ncbi:unnamed protein product [Cylindrotheca closterium]|uniref:Citrate transporter-like domain-containing protein n=1 Tax=Cylindrotheca closterium TaxID=2856 RepID=A0AAD2G0R2_9STRA|nr:unnamed protein product [Cylindrotheca closterium]
MAEDNFGSEKLPELPEGGVRRRRKQTSLDPRVQHAAVQRIRQTMYRSPDEDMMGPILRRKKVVSVPIGGAAGNAFFDPPASSNHQSPAGSPTPARRKKELSFGDLQKRTLGIGNILKRKQVSLDLYGAEQADFFGHVDEDVDEEEEKLIETVEEDNERLEAPATTDVVEEEEVQIFRPLRFSKPLKVKPSGGGGHGHGGGGAPAQSAVPDEHLRKMFDLQRDHNRELKVQVDMLTDQFEDKMQETENEKLLHDIRETQLRLQSDLDQARAKVFGDEGIPEGDETPEDEEAEEEIKEDGIIRATRSDYLWTGILLCVMIAFTGIVIGWRTHLDEAFSTFGPVGLACSTPCTGHLETHDYFRGKNTFEEGQYIQLILELDPNPNVEMHVAVQIVGKESGQVKVTEMVGPPSPEIPLQFTSKMEVTFENPHEEHIINVTSWNATSDTESDVVLTYKLHATPLSSLAKHSELIAALIMVFVYLFILLEVIHRTLVAIYGSLIAILFFFIIHEGESESITTVMLHMEWSTLGLLFGMMLIVGELSHTGIFEWVAVRILVASKGSYNRLMTLLCLLTAVASAFLDNVTTMLLIAPVTIDMCSILNVDPRPYLIGEVLLSNVGGTATLIGDPPNIIIGSSFEEIGFVDFIIHIMPCIFLLCIPVSLVLVLYLYRHYMNIDKMPELDKDKLYRTYQVYDEPRLLIAGTVSFFVILIFFLHPVHHKDTAWVALLGAFITMTFTNPHDVQEALRNHVEWDTLLFFAGLFVLVEVCAALGLLRLVGNALADLIEGQEEEDQLGVAITLILWVSAITSAFLDNIPYTATMIPVIKILGEELQETLPIKTLAWALSFGACLGGNGTLLGASANIVTAGIATNKGYEISFLNFFYPGIVVMIATTAVANLYMMVVYVWAA